VATGKTAPPPWRLIFSWRTAQVQVQSRVNPLTEREPHFTAKWPDFTILVMRISMDSLPCAARTFVPPLSVFLKPTLSSEEPNCSIYGERVNDTESKVSPWGLLIVLALLAFACWGFCWVSQNVSTMGAAALAVSQKQDKKPGRRFPGAFMFLPRQTLNELGPLRLDRVCQYRSEGVEVLATDLHGAIFKPFDLSPRMRPTYDGQ
jgi:hypothetical protein